MKCESNHAESIIGLCFSESCNGNRTYCSYCFNEYHTQHQNECKNFQILTQQLTDYQTALYSYVQEVKIQKRKFDEKYQIFLDQTQEFIQQLHSINPLTNEKLVQNKNVDIIDFVKNYQMIYKNNIKSNLVSSFYQMMNQLQFNDLNTFQINNQMTDDQNIDLIENTIDNMLQQSIQLFEQNNFSQSLKLSEKILRIEKYNQQAIIKKLQCLMKMKKYEDVIKECDRNIINYSQCFNIFFKKSEALIELQQYHQALENIQKGIQINPTGVNSLTQENIKSFNSSNLSQVDAENIKQIITLLQQIIHENQIIRSLSSSNLIEENPNFNPIKNQTEFGNLSDDQKQQVHNEIKQLITTLNSIYDQTNYIIQDYQDFKQQQEIHEQNKQLPTEKNNAIFQDESLRARLSRGDMLINQKNYEEAINVFESIIQQDSKSWIAHYNKALCLQFLMQHEEAIKFSNLAIKIDSQRYDSYFVRGSSQLSLYKYEEAIESFQQVIKLDPTQHKAYALNGVALHNLRRYSEAITQFDLALFISFDVQYLIKKGHSLLENQNYQEAITTYENALLAGAENIEDILDKLKTIQIN